MKELRGTASAAVAASAQDCVQFLAAVDRYPSWYPEVVREVEVLERERGARPTRARTVLHVARGPLVKDIDLVLAIAVQERSEVKLTRVPEHPGDQERFAIVWRLDRDGETEIAAGIGTGTKLALELDASLAVPRLVPLGGVGEAFAESFLAAAVRALGLPRSSFGARQGASA